MRSQIYKTFLILFLVLATIALLSRHRFLKPVLAQPQETKKVQRWEYCYMSAARPGKDSWKVTVSRGGEPEEVDSDTTGAAALNKLGGEGWELVGISDEITNQGNQTFTKFFFKRPR